MITVYLLHRVYLYVIHVKTNEGEKVLKWFGALRPIDLDTF